MIYVLYVSYIIYHIRTTVERITYDTVLLKLKCGEGKRTSLGLLCLPQLHSKCFFFSAANRR